MGRSSVEQQEGAFGLLPILPKERIWGSVDFAMVNIGLAIATWCFLIGGTLSSFVDLKMGFAATLAGNTISILIMALASALPSCKYGVDQYVFLRSIFGQSGTKIAMLMILLIEFGWVAVLCIMFGKASSNVYGSLMNIAQPSNPVVIAFALLAIVISWIIVAKGPVSINWLNRIVAPGLVIMLFAMFYVLSQQYSFAEMLAFKPLNPDPDRWWNYMVAFELGLGSGLSWWPIMGGLSRLTKTQRAAFWPNMIGVNLCAVLGTMVGLLAGLAVGSSDPTEWMIPIGGPLLGLVALVFIAFANITSITSIAYSVSLALKQIKGFMHTDWTKLTFFFLFPVAPLVFFPDQIYGNFGTFLAICGTVLGPLTGIGFVDYFLLRKQRIELAGLYSERPGQAYYYWGGYNYAAIAVLIIATAAYFLLLDPVTFASSSLFLYLSASLPVTVLAGLLHYAATKLVVIPRGLGGYRQSGEPAETSFNEKSSAV
jgi:NCS1 family nucleobase:cation symporter-1